jgi:hypothetical protein
VLPAPDLPAPACTLADAARRARAGEWRALLATATLRRSRSRGMIVLELPEDARTHSELTRLLDAERACCPFLEFKLEQRDGALRLSVGAPPGAGALLDELFGSAAD